MIQAVSAEFGLGWTNFVLRSTSNLTAFGHNASWFRPTLGT